LIDYITLSYRPGPAAAPFRWPGRQPTIANAGKEKVAYLAITAGRNKTMRGQAVAAARLAPPATSHTLARRQPLTCLPALVHRNDPACPG